MWWKGLETAKYTTRQNYSSAKSKSRTSCLATVANTWPHLVRFPALGCLCSSCWFSLRSTSTLLNNVSLLVCSFSDLFASTSACQRSRMKKTQWFKLSKLYLSWTDYVTSRSFSFSRLWSIPTCSTASYTCLDWLTDLQSRIWLSANVVLLNSALRLLLLSRWSLYLGTTMLPTWTKWRRQESLLWTKVYFLENLFQKFNSLMRMRRKSFLLKLMKKLLPLKSQKKRLKLKLKLLKLSSRLMSLTYTSLRPKDKKLLCQPLANMGNYPTRLKL